MRIMTANLVNVNLVTNINKSLKTLLDTKLSYLKLLYNAYMLLFMN